MQEQPRHLRIRQHPSEKWQSANPSEQPRRLRIRRQAIDGPHHANPSQQLSQSDQRVLKSTAGKMFDSKPPEDGVHAQTSFIPQNETSSEPRKLGTGKEFENTSRLLRGDQLDHPTAESRIDQPRNLDRLKDSISVDEHEENIAQHWKHVRRLDPISSPQRSIPDGFQESKALEDFEAIKKAKILEEDREKRMEKTKDGNFVGLRELRHGRGAKKFRPSRLLTPTPEVEAPLTQATNTQASSWRDLWTSKPPDVWARWQPGTTTVEPQPSEEHESLSSSEVSITASDSQDLARNADSKHDWKAFKSDDFLELVSSTSDRSANQTRDRTEPKNASKGQQQAVHVPQRVARDTERSVSPHIRGNDRSHSRRKKNYASDFDGMDDDEGDRMEKRLERKRQREKAKAAQKAAARPTPIHLPEFISVSNLAGMLKVRVEDFNKKMQELGFSETNNDHVLDAETAGLVAAEFNFEPVIDRTADKDLLPRPPVEDKSLLPQRPPVVTIMGHVDHGKTTLLDHLRKSSVAASEHGGITQHIGAFSVLMPGGRLVTFLDTPGHEAFLSMRQRGANVTDIVILVVAADDSVKPQTVEAIKHAQAAKVPIIVAVNKIDKEESNVERVKQDLARYSVEIEDYGGDTQVVCVSGKTGQGMDELEDAAVALADILDMRAETDGQAEGWVLEATTKKAGRVATVLVRRGTLRRGDIIVAGTSWARVRSLRNEAGAMLRTAGPGTPVEIDGWREQPAAGDEVLQAPDEQKAKDVIEYRLARSERERLATDMAAVNEARRAEQERREQLEKAAELAQANPGTTPEQAAPEATASTPSFQEVFFVVKADVSGSAEAVTNSVSALGNSEVRPRILRSGVGPVTEFDIDHAAVANGHIISFNTALDGHISRLAESKGVQILDQSIIYRLVDEVKAKLSEKLPPTVTQRVLGEAEIAQVFDINVKGRVTVPVAGCKVRNGFIGRSGKIRVLRNKENVYDGTFFFSLPSIHHILHGTKHESTGTLSSLKNVKKDVTEMRKGTECGMGFENWVGFKVGDQVQSYEEIIEKRHL